MDDLWIAEVRTGLGYSAACNAERKHELGQVLALQTTDHGGYAGHERTQQLEEVLLSFPFALTVMGQKEI